LVDSGPQQLEPMVSIYFFISWQFWGMSFGVKPVVCKRFDPRGVYTYFEGTWQKFAAKNKLIGSLCHFITA
jgi:hypothetical protein